MNTHPDLPAAHYTDLSGNVHDWPKGPLQFRRVCEAKTLTKLVRNCDRAFVVVAGIGPVQAVKGALSDAVARCQPDDDGERPLFAVTFDGADLIVLARVMP